MDNNLTISEILFAASLFFVILPGLAIFFRVRRAKRLIKKFPQLREQINRRTHG